MKQGLRRQVRSILQTLPADQAVERSRRACKLLMTLEEYRKASVVMVYMHLPNEVVTSSIILEAFQAEKTVLAPRVTWEHMHMDALEIRSLENGFVTRTPGPPLREPVYGEPWPIEEIDFIVIPALAFDRRGNRLGWGKGFYDRFLGRPHVRAFRCGLAFAEQVVDAVPTISTDEPMDALVTDREILRFRR